VFPRKQKGTAKQWGVTWPLDRLFFGITATVLVFLSIVLALGIRQYLLYDQCRQAVASSDRLLFQFTVIKDHLNEALILWTDVNLRTLNSDLQHLEKEAEGLSRNILVPEGLKSSLLSRADLVGLEVRLRAVQEQRPEKTKETVELVRSLNTLNLNLQQFRFSLGDFTQMVLLGLHKIIAGALGLIVAMTCTLLFLLNRHLAGPVLDLCRMTGTPGQGEEGVVRVRSLEALTARIHELTTAAGEQGKAPAPEWPGHPSPDQLHRETLRYCYAATGCISSELASELTNNINGVINYTQTLIDIDAQGDHRHQCAALHQSLLKEEKKIAGLVAGMQLVSPGHGARAASSSLPSLFKMLALVLDKPLRAEAIVFTVPSECRYEVPVPAEVLWLVLLTLVQVGRRALNLSFPGKQREKSLSIACVPNPQNIHRLTLRCTNSANSWEEEAVASAPWPSLSFCTHLLAVHQSGLIMTPDQGQPLLLDLPCRNSVV